MSRTSGHGDWDVPGVARILIFRDQTKFPLRKCYDSSGIVSEDVDNRESFLEGPGVHDPLDCYAWFQRAVLVGLGSEATPEIPLFRVIEFPVRKFTSQVIAVINCA